MKSNPGFNDLQKAAKVRSKGLDDLLSVLNDDEKVKGWSEYKKAVLLKMSANLLPRLNEHTGQDGAELKSIVYLPAKPDGVETK
jgi:hypothetical protein